MEKKLFYRVSNTETNQGLWYSYEGVHTGLIHKKFSFCKSKDLPMPFNEEAVGYLSTTDSIDDLWNWFPREDILRLQDNRYFLHIYESSDYKVYMNHYLIKQDSCKIIGRILLYKPE